MFDGTLARGEKAEAKKYAISVDDAALIDAEPYRFIPEFIRADEVGSLETTRERRYGSGSGILEFLKTTKVVPAVVMFLVYPVLVYQKYYSHYISSTVNAMKDNLFEMPFFFYFGIAGLFFVAIVTLREFVEGDSVSRVAKTLFPSILFILPFIVLSGWFVRTGFWWFPVVTYLLFFIVHLVPLSSRHSGTEYVYGDARIGWQKYAANVDESLVRSWGVAGGHIAENTQFGERAEVGARGERRTGKVLSTLSTVFPHVRVFHGLCFTPGCKGADIDHAVLVNNRLILIDSKNWRYGCYSWYDNDGMMAVALDRSRWSPGEVKMETAVKLWQEYMGDKVVVEGLLCLANSKSDQYVVNNFGAPDKLSMVTLNSLLDYIHGVADTDERVVDRVALKKVVAQLQ